ncbi:torsin interacting protein [Arctopsyche grandis]|uniref:torsin interacting protein n=1 Tax=Arctopsyche grandis TaxID=121162 RepID=UPI00406D7CEB
MASSPKISRRIENNGENVKKTDKLNDEQISTSSSSDNIEPEFSPTKTSSDCSSSDDDAFDHYELSKNEAKPASNIRGRESIHHKTNPKLPSSLPDSRQYKITRDVTDFSKSSTTVKSKPDTNPNTNQQSSPKETIKIPKPVEKRPSYLTGLAFLFFSICAFPYIIKQDNADTRISHPIEIRREIKTISSDYPIQNKDVWNQLLSGIQRLINQEKEPAIFFLVQWSEEHNTAFNIALAAGYVTARNLSYPEDVIAPVVLSPDILNHLDRGDLIDLYQKDLEISHVLIVRDIEKVSPHVAQDFRYYCDEDNPLVDKAIIFFIMNMENCAGVTLENIYKGPIKDTIGAVEKCLTDFWGSHDGLHSTILYPVLSRLINIVLPIQDVPKNTLIN